MKNSGHRMLGAVIFVAPIALCPSRSIALDCSKEAPFAEVGRVKVGIELARFSQSDKDSNEDSCSGEVIISAFDVRGRENSAYYCLKPAPGEMLSCKSAINGVVAWVNVVPAVWIRSSKGASLTEVRFHAYVQENARPDAYIDIFSRTLSEAFPRNKIILEGASSYGPASCQSDNYWVRTTFEFPEVSLEQGISQSLHF
jgi:hypothetical protein